MKRIFFKQCFAIFLDFRSVMCYFNKKCYRCTKKTVQLTMKIKFLKKHPDQLIGFGLLALLYIGEAAIRPFSGPDEYGFAALLAEKLPEFPQQEFMLRLTADPRKRRIVLYSGQTFQIQTPRDGSGILSFVPSGILFQHKRDITSGIGLRNSACRMRNTGLQIPEPGSCHRRNACRSGGFILLSFVKLLPNRGFVDTCNDRDRFIHRLSL